MPVLAGLLGTAAAPTIAGKIAGTVGGALLGNKLAQRSNKKLAQYSFNKNVEMWKMQNAYNAPKQQMSRLKEAGLNPNLMYGKGTVGNAQTMPQYQTLPSSGEVFGQSVAGLQGIVEVGKKKQELAMAQLDAQFKKDTLTARTAVQTYIEQLKRVEMTQELYGIRGQQAYQILFQHMNENTLMTPDQMYKVIAIAKGSEIAMGALKNLGLGFLLNKKVKTAKGIRFK